NCRFPDHQVTFLSLRHRCLVYNPSSGFQLAPGNLRVMALMVATSPVVGADFAIRALDVVKSYVASAAPVLALRGVSLEIRRGEGSGLLGKSGWGKSTLLNVLGGLDRPTSGQVWVAGQELTRMSSARLARYRLATVGMIFQAFNLIASRTALQNVELPMVF